MSRLSGSPRAGLWAALAAVTAIWIAAWLQWWLYDLVVPWDSKNQFYAFFRFLASSLHSGATPFWNAYHYAGHPSIADPQSLIFQPPFLIWAWFDAEPNMFAFDFIVFAHLLVGGLALVVHGHRLGWPAAGSVLAAAIFMLGGVVSGGMAHVGIITAFGLFPLALLLLDIALGRRSILAAIGFTLVAVVIALGRTQTPMLLSVLLAVMAIRQVVTQPEPWRFLLGRLHLFVIMAILGVALMAVPLLLTAQFAAFSNRPGIDLGYALMSSWYPVNFANFLVPDVFGALQPSATGDWGPSHGTRPGIDSTDRAFNYLFAGSLTALLVLWHGLAGGRLVASGRRVFAAVALVAFCYALGRYTPLFPLLFQYAPGVSQFRRPVGGLFGVVVAFAYLSGFLVADYVRNGLPRVNRLVAVPLALAVVSVLAWAVHFSSFSGKGWDSALAIAKVAPIYVALAVLLAWPKTPRLRLAAASLAVAFTAGELVLRNAASSMNAEPRATYAFLEKPAGRDAQIIATLTREMKRSGVAGGRPRVEIVGLGGPWQNAAMVYGLEATNGYNPLRIGAYDRLVAPGESPYTVFHRRFPTSFPGYSCDLGRLLGLEYIVLDRPIERMPHLAQWSTVETIMAGPTAWIYRLPDAAPRVALASIVRVADADAFVDAGLFPPSNGTSEVMIDDDDDLSPARAAAAASAQAPITAGRDSRAAATLSPAVQALMRSPGKAEITAWRPDRIEIAVDARVSTVLSLHEPWYPGWEVEVNGERKPLLRSDILFRGVEVPAGASRVVFTYRPLSLENLKSALDGVLGRDS
ncbi:MAG: YfhO family protein [Phreatobacter sp.]|nr:YfhO family protein [Phreatobacter sp.]